LSGVNAQNFVLY